MLKQNTQLCCGSAENDLSCHLSTNNSMMRYNKRINSQFFTVTFFVDGDASSTSGNKYAQMFVSDIDYVKVYPLIMKSECTHDLHMFCQENGLVV